MKYKWLNRQENSKIIIFFNGWGMDENVVKHLNCENFDVLMFYDYNTLDTDFDFSTLNIYKTKNLIAWSMGVMCATYFDIDYDEKIAVNGTLKPIDNEFGIPVKIYDLTVKGFSELSSKKFINNMFSEKIDLVINRDLENQKNELKALKEYQSNLDFKYTKCIISNNDKIIPTKNQINFWKTEANFQSGHCPFFEIQKWSELL